MKRFTLLFIFLLAFFQSFFGQYSINEELVDKTVLIEFEEGSSGSGFFFQDSLNLYLVTARHVILNEVKDYQGKVIDYSLKSQFGKIKFYARNSDKSEANEMSCDFSGLFKAGLMKFGKKDDILVAEIAKIRYEKYVHVEYYEHIKRLGTISMINPYHIELVGYFEDTNLGDDVFIFGFPKSLGLGNISQFDFDRPLLRKGTLAGRYTKNRTIIIDCPSFGGNSGGPVIEITSNNQVKLIGIVTSFIPFIEHWVNPNYRIRNIEIDNSGYSVVEPIDKIIDVINEF